MNSDCLYRSLMFVPANNQKYLDSALRRNADILLLDCEDSVSSSEKDIARKMVLDFVKKPETKGKILIPRINGIDSCHFLKDIMDLSVEDINGFMVPKISNANDVVFIDRLLLAIEMSKGFETYKFQLIPLIESAAGICNANSICTSSPRITAIAFGCEDYLANINGFRDNEDLSIAYARNTIVNAARANNIFPIDTVHTKVNDIEDLRRSALFAKNIGFEGMLVINPRELDIVNEVFSPSKEEYDEAKLIVDLYHEAINSGKGEAILKGKFVGPPMAKSANNIIKKYRKAMKIQGIE